MVASYWFACLYGEGRRLHVSIHGIAHRGLCGERGWGSGGGEWRVRHPIHNTQPSHRNVCQGAHCESKKRQNKRPLLNPVHYCTGCGQLPFCDALDKRKHQLGMFNGDRCPSCKHIRYDDVLSVYCLCTLLRTTAFVYAGIIGSLPAGCVTVVSHFPSAGRQSR